MSLKQSLRELIAEHGVREVYTTLNEYMRQEYTFLTEVFGPKVSSVPMILQESIHYIKHDIKHDTKVPPKNIKVKVRKAQEEPSSVAGVISVPVPVAVPVLAPVLAAVPVPVPVPVHIETETETELEKKFRNPLEVKAYQKAAMDAKHAELTAAGIKGETLLTKENLTQWLLSEGHTYAWISREKTGCPESKVAEVARTLGIKSAITRRREET